MIKRKYTKEFTKKSSNLASYFFLPEISEMNDKIAEKLNGISIEGNSEVRFRSG